MGVQEVVSYAREHAVAISWEHIHLASAAGESIYDWCWVCGLPTGPDKMHVMIDNGRVTRHVYCCRKHRYVAVRVSGSDQTMVQERSDLELETLSFAFRDGELPPGWE